MEVKLIKNKKCNSCDKRYYDEDVTEINLNGILTRLCHLCVEELIVKIRRAR